MKTATSICVLALPFIVMLCPPMKAAAPIKVDTRDLLVSVDGANCRWSAEVKGTPMRLNDVYFLPGDDPSGWKVTSSVNHADSNPFGSFDTVTLHGTKSGHLDFDYQISASKTSNTGGHHEHKVKVKLKTLANRGRAGKGLGAPGPSWIISR